MKAWQQIAIATAGTVLASILVGGVAFANAMDNRTQALEATSKAQGETIRDQRLKVRGMDSSIRRMEKMLSFLAAKAGYVPAEMGTPVK